MVAVSRVGPEKSLPHLRTAPRSHLGAGTTVRLVAPVGGRFGATTSPRPRQASAGVRAGAVSDPIAASFARVGASPHVRPSASTFRRRRAVAAGLVVGLVLAVWAALGVFGGGPLLAPEHPDPAGGGLAPGATYVVQPGDTLWSIAVRIRPQGDPRPVVDELVAGHGGATTLYVGERLRLPR